MNAKKSLIECLNSVGIGYTEEQTTNLETLFKMVECDVEILSALKKDDKPLEDTLSPSEHQYLKLVALTQSALIRPSNKERNELENLDSLDVGKVRTLCQSLGFINEIAPAKGKFPVVGFLGAFQSRVEKRFQWLLKQMRSGDVTDVKIIIVCSGTRALKDFESTINNGCTDETQMIRYVIEKQFPAAEFPDVKFIYSNAKAAVNDLRARTDDTAVKAKEDLSQTSLETPILIISNQPYCAYQGAVYQQSFHPIEVIAVGEEASIECTAPDFYDNITRLFYANAMRYLVINKGMQESAARLLIDVYKKDYFCESLLVRSVSNIHQPN